MNSRCIAFEQILSTEERKSFNEGVERVETELKRLGLDYEYSCHVFTDPDEWGGGDSTVVAEFKIKERAYKEILDIWNSCSFIFDKDMPRSVRNKVALTMDGLAPIFRGQTSTSMFPADGSIGAMLKT